MAVVSPHQDEALDRTLATAYIDGHRLAVVEHHDGTSEITYDGNNVFGRHWGVGQIDTCFGAYLDLLRNRQPAW